MSSFMTRAARLSLRAKTWLILFAGLLMLAALLTISAQSITRSTTERLEKRQLVELVRRIRAVERVELDSLERSSAEFAAWTETYEFMGDPTRPYLEKNVTATSLENLQLDALLLFDQYGQLRTGRLHHDNELTTSGVVRLGDSLKRFAQPSATGSARPARGAFAGPNGVALFAMRPITDSSGTGPTRGMLAQLRWLDEPQVERWRDLTDLELALRKPKMIIAGRALVSETATDYVVTEIDDRSLLLQVPLRDSDGTTIAEWELTIAREVQGQSRQAWRIFLIIMIGGVLFTGALMGWLIQAFVIRRLNAGGSAGGAVNLVDDRSPRISLVGPLQSQQAGAELDGNIPSTEQSELLRAGAEAERDRLHRELQLNGPFNAANSDPDRPADSPRRLGRIQSSATSWPHERAEAKVEPALPNALHGVGLIRPAASRLLLVDDDALVRETLETALRRRNFAITCASSGAEALELIRAGRDAYDIVITDQKMPGMTGSELGEILVREWPKLPIILLTGFASGLDEASVKAIGFDAMLMKPVTIDELIRAVRAASHR